jgi:hypothetical protein
VLDALLRVGPALMGAATVGLGRREEVDPIRHLISTAAGWGGNAHRIQPDTRFPAHLAPASITGP